MSVVYEKVMLKFAKCFLVVNVFVDIEGPQLMYKNSAVLYKLIPVSTKLAYGDLSEKEGLCELVLSFLIGTPKRQVEMKRCF